MRTQGVGQPPAERGAARGGQQRRVSVEVVADGGVVAGEVCLARNRRHGRPAIPLAIPLLQKEEVCGVDVGPGHVTDVAALAPRLAVADPEDIAQH